MENLTEKKKRGRKAKVQDISNNLEVSPIDKIPKKRGRKPKGGKVVVQLENNNNIIETIPNIILHLKCNKSDLDENILVNDIENYQFNKGKTYDFNYFNINSKEDSNKNLNSPINNDNIIDDKDNSKIIWQKLEKLSNLLHLDNVCDKKSSCFFCTCEFDNMPIYIPKYKLKNMFHVYGCFCTPECACAYLMNDKNIDNTARFERYYLLNFIYGKIYNYQKNIKPAPSPYYLLEKYYGNLTIQEYRKLLKSERLLIVVDKPLVRSMPELHDDSDDFLLNNNGIPAATTKYIPQRDTKGVCKNDIVNQNFNISS